MRTAAVVVTYNRKEELLRNINAVLSQSSVVDKYFIIDNNSNSDTKEYLKLNDVFSNSLIEYVYLNENIGGAGGFYTGLKIAYDAGYDYICLMDDDGRPKDRDMMKNLLDMAKRVHPQNKALLLNSLVCGDKEQLSFGLSGGIKTREVAAEKQRDGLIIGTVNPFNGTLISRELVELIGFPNKEFFIKGDEEDYCRRALRAGAFVATVFFSNYYHPILEKKHVNLGGKIYKASTEAPWKEYYRARNYTYMFKLDGERKKSIRQNLKQILWAICYNPRRVETVRMIIKGWRDGSMGRLGPRIKP